MVLGVRVGSGVAPDCSLLCFKTNCEGWRLSFAKPREKLVRISEGDFAPSWGEAVKSRKSSSSFSESEKRDESPVPR